MANYDDSVFINCPFDAEYRPFLDALVFAVHDCGFVARSALEVSDGSQLRFDKLIHIISECKYGIHDISRMELDSTSGLPRFNMPFELGLFLGAKRFGGKKQKEKFSVILDSERYRYQRSLSDLAGLDIRTYDPGDPATVIRAVRDPLASDRTRSVILPGPNNISARYTQFRNQLPAICEELHLSVDDLPFFDYATIVSTWLERNRRWEL